VIVSISKILDLSYFLRELMMNLIKFPIWTRAWTSVHSRSISM